MRRLSPRRSLVLLGALLAAGCAYSTLPLTEPVPKVEPVASIPEPSERKVGAWYAFTEATFFYPLEKLLDLPLQGRRLLGQPQRALDIDAYSEVVDSNWFTNRNLLRPLTPEEKAFLKTISDPELRALGTRLLKYTAPDES